MVKLGVCLVDQLAQTFNLVTISLGLRRLMAIFGPPFTQQ
jgi:hypothetical protein